TFAVQSPWPEEWLNKVAGNYFIPEDWKESELTWLTLLKNDLEEELKSMFKATEVAMDVINTSDGPYHYAEAIQSDQLLINEALKRLPSWDELQMFMKTSKFKRLSVKRIECNEDKKDKVKQIRNTYQVNLKKLTEVWFTRNLPGHVADMQDMYPVIKTVVELVLEF